MTKKIKFWQSKNSNYFLNDFLVDRKQAEESQTSIADLEQIDDDLSTRGVHMVKTCDMEIAEEYGIEKFPSIVYFENGIPYLYPGTLIFQYTNTTYLVESRSKKKIIL